MLNDFIIGGWLKLALYFEMLVLLSTECFSVFYSSVDKEYIK